MVARLDQNPRRTSMYYFNVIKNKTDFYLKTRFHVLMGLDEDDDQNSPTTILPGNAVVMDPQLPFRPLTKFGNSFLNRLQCTRQRNKLLAEITLIDTPGILSGEKQTIERLAGSFAGEISSDDFDCSEDTTLSRSCPGSPREWTWSCCCLMPTSWISVTS